MVSGHVDRFPSLLVYSVILKVLCLPTNQQLLNIIFAFELLKKLVSLFRGQRVSLQNFRRFSFAFIRLSGAVTLCQIMRPVVLDPFLGKNCKAVSESLHLIITRAQNRVLITYYNV